ncbi:magnesium/cobalt transporter CorA [Aquicella lusitana]|mgnify:CR=1 FL=1|uniref:Magnesium transport protein CorA n=1 Tax=Aquicella lusitana TaxID=254246 RepID=A0A370G5F3_9COXI|nr:magnesium/cobalt transporter CorA [Aquicella lusitana]RDI39047.1 magnesium transporter [Aquicella lusitana]VVC73654.1 Magnesium transport protein CorA [Aquicella lusitana]
MDMFSEVRKRARKAGQPPGTATYTGNKTPVKPVITVITYDADHAHEATGTRLEDCLPEAHKPAGTIWVNIEGLSTDVVTQVAKQFNLHPLTVEDILNVEQRPKIEEFDDYLFLTLKTLSWHPKESTFSVSQLSLVIGHDFVLSFQEADTSLFDVIAERLQSTSNQRMRQQGSDYLAYRLIDSVVDEYFVVLEAMGDQIETTEERIIKTPSPQSSRTLYRLKRQMLLLRKGIWPMREILGHLLHTEEKIITDFTRLYLRDVYDHTVQAIDTVETFRDMLSSMLDMYLSSLTNRMNEIMKTLTIIATIFIPITCIASIYGMNFTHMPGLRWYYSYAVVMGIMVLIAISMLLYFHRKKWI